MLKAGCASLSRPTGCGELLIDRLGYRILKNSLKEGRCPKCQAEIDGVWE